MEQPAARAKQRPWILIVVLAIIGGLVLSCAILPLGLFAIASAGSPSSNQPLSAFTWQEQVVEGSGSDRIALVEVSGVIGAGGDALFGGGLSTEQLLSQIRQAAADSRVKALLVRVDSPGGGVVASAEIHSELQAVRESGKPVVISMGSTAASGGYYIATAADRIYAHPDTLTGSLGVIISYLRTDELYETLGVAQQVYKSGPLKDIGSAARPPTPEEDAVFQSVVDEAYQGFVDRIVEGRKLPREEVLRIADGRIYTGKQALDLKLVDLLGDQDDAIAGTKELANLSDALVVRYTASGSLRDILLGASARLDQPADPLGVRELLRPGELLLEYRLVP
ncbi:MAG: signal peptide peptidase SppA [Roseiflexaceae bacterium]|nr:signal peptide peptidase SppA [Roseiflexaceae bacterium]